ncbi:MAG: DUF3341 domain-containing protein [Dehalococcoidia bacterium]|nr:DUF3341 domain-containing protein [Dehalococcoidia bacterium]
MANASILGVFKDVDSAVAGADNLNAAGFNDFEVLSGSPYPEGAFGEKPPRHKLYVFPLIGAMCGFTVGLLLTAGTQIAYPMVTGGKPILSLPPMAIISYEGTMLGAVLFTILGVIFESRLPRPRLGLYDTRITEGYIGLFVTAPEEQIARAEKALRDGRAVDVKSTLQRARARG